MTKKQTTQDNIFYFQEVSQDILNLSLRFSYEEIGFYLTFKAAYIFHKGKIPYSKINQFCRVFNDQEKFTNFIKNNFKVEDDLVISESFNNEIDFISKKSQEKKKAANSRWKNANADAIAYPNADANGDAKQETRNIKQETRNKKQETTDLINNQFEEFWQSYIPVKTKDGYVKKGSKDKALKSFYKALKKASFEKIMKALEDYLLYCSNNNRFTKNAVTWLNDADFDAGEDAVIISKSNEKEQKNSAIEAYKSLLEKYKNEDHNEELN